MSAEQTTEVDMISDDEEIVFKTKADGKPTRDTVHVKKSWQNIERASAAKEGRPEVPYEEFTEKYIRAAYAANHPDEDPANFSKDKCSKAEKVAFKVDPSWIHANARFQVKNNLWIKKKNDWIETHQEEHAKNLADNAEKERLSDELAAEHLRNGTSGGKKRSKRTKRALALMADDISVKRQFGVQDAATSEKLVALIAAHKVHREAGETYLEACIRIIKD